VAASGNADDVRSDELNVHASSSRMRHISERQGKSEGVCREFDGLDPRLMSAQFVMSSHEGCNYVHRQQ
jgi:hypothetical protein